MRYTLTIERMTKMIQKQRHPYFKRLILLALVLALSFPGLAHPAVMADESHDLLTTGLIEGEHFEFDRSQLHSRTACLAVYNEGRQSELLHFREEEVVYIASLTKIMTALVAYDLLMETGKSLDDLATVRPSDLAGLAELNASMAGFQSGETVPFRDLFYGLLLSSGCEAANTLGRETAGSVTAFIEKMNEKARDLGLKHSQFANTSGLFDVNNYSSAQDVTTLLLAASEHDFLKDVMKTRYYTSKATNKHESGLTMVHTLALYGAEADIDIKIIDGGKTGQLKESGYCLSSFKTIGERLYVLTTTGAFNVGEHVADHVTVYEALLAQLPSEDAAITGIGERIPIVIEPGSPEGESETSENLPKNTADTLTTIAAILLAVLIILGLILFISALMKRRMEQDQLGKK
jgi:D-alanyl-D-alanine carboxypeptidase (penicillin-binding protein 5/6)